MEMNRAIAAHTDPNLGHRCTHSRLVVHQHHRHERVSSRMHRSPRGIDDAVRPEARPSLAARCQAPNASLTDGCSIDVGDKVLTRSAGRAPKIAALLDLGSKARENDSREVADSSRARAPLHPSLNRRADWPLMNG